MRQLRIPLRANYGWPAPPPDDRTQLPALGVVEVAVFLAAHVFLALLIRQVTAIATMHAICVVAVAVWIAIRGRDPERLAYMAAYITGAEVMWRMNYASIFWEFGKYAICAMLIVWLLRKGRPRSAGLGSLYFLLLLPSALITLTNTDIEVARRQISFNLSGPLALALGVWFFSGVTLSKEQLGRVVVAFLGPVSAIAASAISGTLAAAAINFDSNSNWATSGGFGPNQVSAVLGLGAFLCFFYLLYSKTSSGLKALLIVTLSALAVQSALTFSRGGLYLAGAAAMLTGLFLVRQKKGTARMLQVAPILVIAAIYVIVPRLVEFTGGAISERFSETDLTGRGSLMEGDLKIFTEYPLFGVGPGMGREIRANYGARVAAHTEYTRMLAEHGLLGLAALIVLLVLAVRTFARAKAPEQKALTSSLIAWSLLFMWGNGMRLAAPSIMFSLACATIAAERRSAAHARKVIRVAARPLDRSWKHGRAPVPDL